MENYGVSTLETKTADNLIGGSHESVMIPVTVASGSGVLERGTVLGRVTADGKYVPYKAANADGSQVPRAVLAARVDATDADVKTSVYVHGEFNSKAMTGIDAAAKLKLQEFGIFIKEAK